MADLRQELVEKTSQSLAKRKDDILLDLLIARFGEGALVADCLKRISVLDVRGTETYFIDNIPMLRFSPVESEVVDNVITYKMNWRLLNEYS